MTACAKSKIDRLLFDIFLHFNFYLKPVQKMTVKMVGHVISIKRGNVDAMETLKEHFVK